MPAALFILIGCQLIGEVLRTVLHLPIPGPVIGMFLLAAVLAGRQSGGRQSGGRQSDGRQSDGRHSGGLQSGTSGAPAAPSSLQRTADALIAHMGLLFVPAGVGVIAQVGLLRTQWFPIVAALVGSTVLSLIVTGLMMHWTGRTEVVRETPPPVRQANLEASS
jgi:holin-like protein